MSAPLASPSSGGSDPPKELNAFERFVKKVPHKAHKNLLIRGFCAAAHAVLSLTLAAAGDNRPKMLFSGIFQLLACWTLVHQFRTANPYMFIARGFCSWARVVIILYGAACGGNTWPGEECVTGAWSDVRTPFRVLACFSALRMFLNGLSLMLQYRFPRRGVGQHGNEQLFYRGIVQASGVPLHYMLFMLKLGELSDTKFQRPTLELVVHFLRLGIIVPIAAWSLFDQWVSTGSGQKTDDLRTLHVGEKHPNAAHKLTAKISPHKGHRNLLIRCMASFTQASYTVWLVGYDINRKPQSLYMLCQLTGSLTLFIQWRTGNPRMFIARAIANWVACIVAIYQASCGATWPGEECVDEAWQDDRISLRILGSLAAFRLFCNGLSLFCQYKMPWRMLGAHGNEQLFYRGCVQASGIPIHLARFLIKATDDGLPMDYTINFIRAFFIIPMSAISLFHQWKHTGPGNTGNARSDMFEREKDPNVVDKDERIRVTIVNAKDLRRADMGGKSDPYCVCTVVGRPESKFQTQFLQDTLNPEWNECQELPVYKQLDSLEFIVRDHDEESKVPCCKMFDDGDDLLGKVVVKSEDIHPGGFSGEVKLTHAGRSHKDAAITIKIEILGEAVDAAAKSGSVEGAATILGGALEAMAEEVVDVVKEVRDCAGQAEPEAEPEDLAQFIEMEFTESEPVCSPMGPPLKLKLVASLPKPDIELDLSNGEIGGSGFACSDPCGKW